jgi:formylglycine-generating enzyme required for sulfatase activity
MVRVSGETVVAVERRKRVPKIKTASDFWIDRHEVTVAMFRKFCEETGALFPDQPTGSGEQSAVVNITWGEASSYSAWAGKRLPTSWEWAAAALGEQEFPWGSREPDDTQIHFPFWPEDEKWSPRPVESQSNDVSPSGCFDMGGNPQEWVSDERKKRWSEDAKDEPREWRLACGWRIYTVGVSGGPPYAGAGWRDADKRVKSIGFRCAISQ